jgi:hypothetical protein
MALTLVLACVLYVHALRCRGCIYLAGPLGLTLGGIVVVLHCIVAFWAERAALLLLLLLLLLS